jgi:hypothetical protein
VTLSVTSGFSLVLLIINAAAFVVSLFALVDAVLRSSPAFRAVGRGSKTLWVAILAAAVAVAVLGVGIINILAIAGLVAAIVYLVDMRPKLRMLTGGPERVSRR